MRTKTTLFLFILLAALVTVLYYVFPGVDPEESRDVILSAAEAAQLDYLKFEFRDRPNPIVIEKQESGWRITEPVLWPASIFAIDRLRTQLQFLKRVSSFPADRLADYGLDPPEGVLTYGYGAVRKTLRIGTVSDMAHNIYLLPDGGETISVVKRDVLDDLRRPLEELRDNKIFSVPPFEVRSWTVQLQSAEAGPLRVHVVSEGEKWKLESPVPARADKAAVDTLLKRVLELRVAEFWRDDQPDLNALGLANPLFRVTVVGSGSRESLLLGRAVDPEKAPGLYFAKREDNDTIFTVLVENIAQLRNAQVALRDRRVIEVAPDRIQSITINTAGQPSVTLQKLETGAWQVISRISDTGYVTMDGDPGVIGGLVQEIVELSAVREHGFVTDAPLDADLDRTYGLIGATQLLVAERAPGGSAETRVHTITLGRRVAAPGQAPEATSQNLQYAMSDEHFVYLVDRALSDDLRAEPYHYRNRQLRQMAAGESIMSLTLRRLGARAPADEIVFTSTRAGPDQSWADALITQPPERRAAAQSLIAELRNLRAREIVAPEFPKSVPGAAEMRPWTWLLEANIALEGGATPQSTQLRLYLDAYQGGTDLLVGVPDLNLVVSATPGLIDALRPLVLERPDPGVPPAVPATTTPATGAAPATTAPGPASAPGPGTPPSPTGGG